MQPLKPICEEINIRKDGTRLIFIQYCFSSDNRITLNTEIAIPPKYWDKKKLLIRTSLPDEYGAVDELMFQLKQKLRLAEDLADLAAKRKVANKGQFVKEAFNAQLSVNEIEKDKDKFKKLAGEKEEVNLDVYFQIDEYIKVKEKKVTRATVNVFNNTFEEFRKEPVTFDSFDFNFYDTFVDFLTFDYVQSRFKNPVVGLKLNTVGKTVNHIMRRYAKCLKEWLSFVAP